MLGSLILICLAAILFGIAWFLKLSSEADRIRDYYAAAISNSIKSNTQPTQQITQNIEHLQSQIDHAVKLLQEINENTLLNEQGRQQKIEFLALQERKRSFNDIDRLIQEREWAQAKTILELLIRKYPDNPDVKQQMIQLESLRKDAFNEELAQARKTITNFIAISAWDKAIRLAENLIEKHPDMPEARQLLQNIRTERARFREEQIKRMYCDIQKSIARKRWNDALQIGRQLIEKYPDSVEAETIRSQITTLETNAEIEKRQELEEQIKDLVRRRNFIQAVELARFVIANYPTSPQANALRDQLAKLEELAKQQEKEIPL